MPTQDPPDDLDQPIAYRVALSANSPGNADAPSLSDLFEENRGFEDFLVSVLTTLARESFYNDSDPSEIIVYYTSALAPDQQQALCRQWAHNLFQADPAHFPEAFVPWLDHPMQIAWAKARDTSGE